MKHQLSQTRSAGFTLLEILSVVAIMAILAAASVLAYQHYADRAASAELIEQYDTLRQEAILIAGEQNLDLCNVPSTALSLFSGANLDSDIVELALTADAGLQYAKPLGLHIKADNHTEGERNTRIAREAYEVLNRDHIVGPGAILTDSVTSFTALLTNGPCSSTQTTSTPPTPVHTGSAAAQTAAQQAHKDLATATTPQDALEKIAALAAGVPEAELTAVIPGPNAQALQKIGCDVTRLIKPGQPCADMFTSDCKATFGDALTTECVPAQVCPKSAGVCTSVTPEMKAALDQSIIRIREDMRARGQDPDALGIGIY